MTYTIYDLHCHSTSSDGTFSPTEVVTKAKQAGVEVLALTDHDTLEGLAEAKQTAKELDIHFIHGVELSCEHTLTGGYGKNKTTDKIIHIVGLDFHDVDTLNKRLQQIQDSRANRGRAMVAKLAELLVDKGVDELQLWELVLNNAQGNPQAVGRSHIAKALYELGAIKTMQHAFNRYIGDNQPAYVKLETLTMAEGITLIQQCGGKAVLAHPTGYQLSATRVRKLITEFAQLGGDASELPSNKDPLSKRMMVDSVISNNNLAVSIGSDFHGTTMPWRKLGDVPKLTSTQTGIWHSFQ